MEGNYYNFRTAKVGGFNKKDVINYIEKMRNEFYAYKKSVEDTVDQLNAKIRELESATGQMTPVEAVPEGTEVTFKGKDCLADINEAASQLRSVAEKLCKNLSSLMLKVDSETLCEEESEVVNEKITDTATEYNVEQFDSIFTKSSNFWFDSENLIDATFEKIAEEDSIEQNEAEAIAVSDDENSLYAMLGQQSFFY